MLCTVHMPREAHIPPCNDASPTYHHRVQQAACTLPKLTSLLSTLTEQMHLSTFRQLSCYVCRRVFGIIQQRRDGGVRAGAFASDTFECVH